MTYDRVSPLLAASAYLFGFALVLTAAIDLLTTVWPLRPTDMAWRYGFLGLAAGYLQTPALGLGLVGATAIWREHLTALRLAGGLALLAALVLICVMGVFGLDVLAMRQVRAPEAQRGVLVGGAFQEVKYAVAALVFLLFGLGCLNTASRLAAEVSRRAKPGIVSAAATASS